MIVFISKRFPFPQLRVPGHQLRPCPRLLLDPWKLLHTPTISGGTLVNNIFSIVTPPPKKKEEKKEKKRKLQHTTADINDCSI